MSRGEAPNEISQINMLEATFIHCQLPPAIQKQVVVDETSSRTVHQVTSDGNMPLCTNSGHEATV